MTAPRTDHVRPPTPHPSGATAPDIPRELVPRHVALVMDADQGSDGDRVSLMETRPLSATKRWRLIEILEKAK